MSKTFTAIPAQLRDVIKIAQIEKEERKNIDSETADIDSFDFLKRKLVIVTGGKFDPEKDDDIEMIHAMDLVNSFLLSFQKPLRNT